MDLLTNAKFMITLSYGMLSVVLYTIVTFIIFTQKEHFNGSFFRIFISGYFMNLWTYGNSFISIRLPQNTRLNGTFSAFFLSHGAENVDKNQFPLEFFYMMHFHFAYSQYLFNLLTSVNRSTAIFLPMKFEKIWNKVLYPTFVIVYASPFIFTFPIFLEKAYYVYNPFSNYFYIVSEYSRASTYSKLMPFLVICTISNILLNATAFKRFMFMNRSGGKIKESNLFYMTLTTFLIEVFVSILTIFNYLSSNKMQWLLMIFEESHISSLSYVAQFLTPFASDLLTFSHPWLMLVFSRSVRQRIVKKLRGQVLSEIFLKEKETQRNPMNQGSLSVAAGTMTETGIPLRKTNVRRNRTTFQSLQTVN